MLRKIRLYFYRITGSLLVVALSTTSRPVHGMVCILHSHKITQGCVAKSSSIKKSQQSPTPSLTLLCRHVRDPGWLVSSPGNTQLLSESLNKNLSSALSTSCRPKGSTTLQSVEDASQAQGQSALLLALHSPQPWLTCVCVPILPIFICHCALPSTSVPPHPSAPRASARFPLSKASAHFPEQ